MATRYLIDSNVVIDYTAGLLPQKGQQFLSEVINQEINVSILTQIEVLSFNPSEDDDYQTLVEFFQVANIFDLVTNGAVANKTIEIRQKQKIKLPDAVIAATALINNFTLITRNAKDFKTFRELI